MFGVTLDMGGCYWFGALQGPLHRNSSSAIPRPCPTSEEQSNEAKPRERACSGLLWTWMAATGLELCKGHFSAKAVLPFLDLARQVRKNVTPDWGQVTGKGLFGVTLDMDGCYWFGALQGRLHCNSSSAIPRPCPTSEEQSSLGLRPSHGKRLVRHWIEAKSRERASSGLL